MKRNLIKGNRRAIALNVKTKEKNQAEGVVDSNIQSVLREDEQTKHPRTKKGKGPRKPN